ncbi:hypothetical protein ACTTBA_02130 [Shewanella frigidimarina]|uniref:hypothetical protein n=1 Tax=Shewanella frigidimarina TaxID=56812 RepID=UPI003F9F5AEC
MIGNTAPATASISCICNLSFWHCQGWQGLVSIYDGAKDVFLSFLPQSGFVQQEIKQGQKTVGFAPSSLILTNYFLPVI